MTKSKQFKIDYWDINIDILTVVVALSILIILIAIPIYFLRNITNITNITIDHFNSPSGNISINIGNWICEYIYDIATSILLQKDFTYNIPDIDFVKHLPKFIKYANIDPSIYTNLTSKGITYDSFTQKHAEKCAIWFINDNIDHNFWICLKPLIQSILDDALIKSNLKKIVEFPVIHFRCADVPFVRHRQYHLQKYKFYKKALENINTLSLQQYSKVIILSCSFHLSDNKDQACCSTYTNSLSDYLKNISYDTIVECNTNIADFATLFYAPAVISGGSSFSFISGFCGKGIFISGGHIEEADTTTNLKCDSCSTWLQNADDIKHKDIDDYYNTDAVINILQN
jgi:hypothetical protein